MSVLTYDLETTTATLHKRKASPFNADNYIVAAGFKRDDGPATGSYYASREASELNYSIPFHPEDNLLIGFNIKFDLLYSWHRPELQEFFARGGKIWDCQYVQYLIEGHRQQYHMASMDATIEEYGGTLKIDAVKELWARGVDTPDIDEDLLMDYLLGNEEVAGDVNNTYLIYQGQLDRIKDMHPNFTAMVERRMDGLLATTEMEYNGLKIDRERGEADRAVLADRVAHLEDELEAFIPELPEELTFNWQSIYHKSYLIYGGVAKYEKWVQHTDEAGMGLYCQTTEKWPLFGGTPVRPEDCEQVEDDQLARRVCDGSIQDSYKSGKRQGEGKTKAVQCDDLTRPKGAKVPHTYRFEGYTKPPKEWASNLTDGDDNPIYSTSSDNLETLVSRNGDVPFLRTLGERNKATKDLGTYYWATGKDGTRKGMLTLVNDTGFIHHKLNHTSTVTSRLSSSDPNMQNIPRGDKSDAKAMFVSRFGDDGVMAELDYSQLEVVIQAILTRDPQLIEDLNNGIDFHCKRLAAKLKLPYEDIVAGKSDKYAQQRTAIKGFTFARAYGGGVASIAADTGMPEDDVQELIEIEEALYPGITAFDQMVETNIGATTVTTTREIYVAGQRFNIGVGEWSSPTGIRYIWSESETPAFMHRHHKFVGFSPTERKNWPIQGEGGFVMQAMLGYLFRLFNKNKNFDGKAYLVNTVHDCVWLDLHKDVVDTVVPQVKAILQAVPSMYKRAFNIDIPVPFPVDAEVGTSMLDLQHYTGNTHD